LKLAYLQALNIKVTQPGASCAVIVDTATEETVNASHRNVFDYIINCDSGGIVSGSNPFEREARAFWLTPYKETIKVESDLLFTRDIDHWWTALRLKNVVLATGCKNYWQLPSQVRKYRKVFDDNKLPDVYNGLMYFRYSQEAQRFFTAARDIFANWADVRDSLKNCRDDQASTDLVYAIAAQLIGPENCTIPSLDFFNFVHMKSGIQGWSDDNSWTDYVVSEHTDTMLRINNLNQYSPVHYHNKEFATDELIEYYEQRIRTSI
jgi:hypothetical protein